MKPAFEEPSVSPSSSSKGSVVEDKLFQDSTPIDEASEKRLLWKCDLHVVPIISFLYVLSFLDRINIGNARIQGLEKDLNMSGQDYNIALMVFFIPYILFEVPSNILIRKLAPSTWLSVLMVCWGITTACMGVTKSFSGLVVCRTLLGLFEAGFFPGCLYLMSMYYRRYELQKRFTFFFCSAVLTGAFSGLLAYAIASMSGVGGYSGWRWIFIIEGLLTVIAAVVAKFFIADWPEKAKFLNAEERCLLRRRLAEDGEQGRMDRLDGKAKFRVFTDWKIYMGIIMYVGIVNTGYSTSFFIPTILHQLGWTAVYAQVLTIPIYIASFVVAVITAVCTDRLRHRYAFIMVGIVTSTIGYAVLLAQQSVPVGAKYFALYMVVIGGYIAQPIILVWVTNNMGGHYKRSISTAMQVGFGNIGGVVASNIFITKEAPLYQTGYGVSLGLLWLCGLASTAFLIGLKRENRKRDNGERDDRYWLSTEELENLGDDHPRFRFSY